ncbi:AAA family ATPase [Nibribacter ruber]|uniref:Shikimate kinase n=1 Tax=Nibribacter ruber TaxID=2698458 RepID=A0A6P1P296_9BACT|nr:shikimate kinase [Nibribacter ruber]QHL88526.1 AAA family ATPase [Nibribacter ruber]
MSNAVRIFLVGMPGSGKSTVGKMLAQKLELEFLDLDALIIEQEGLSIAEIFERRGQDYFREAEASALRSLESKPGGLVVATGGGAPCFLGNMDYLLSTGIAVYLKVSARELLKRFTDEELRVRPLLQNKSETELLAYLTETLAHREQFYKKAQVVVDTAGVSIETTVQVLEKQVLPCLHRF